LKNWSRAEARDPGLRGVKRPTRNVVSEARGEKREIRVQTGLPGGRRDRVGGGAGGASEKDLLGGEGMQLVCQKVKRRETPGGEGGWLLKKK